MRSSKLLLILALLLLAAFAAPLPCLAGGPRWVTGPPFFTGPAGVAIGWKQTRLLYFTDPGNLSATVNHQAADALVATASSVWNVPVANITLAQGGSLAQHVSGQNVYLDSTGMHFPADVSTGNAAAVPIAIIYDSDGSVTDTLLGSGASDPSGCRQNAVTESVDAFDPAGYILHALIIINGRCSGSAPEMQLQLRYQLMRVFGRVLGLAWSQTNDNVFTGIPTPTNVQAQNWPILHPLDILCGPYTYQCLPNPFKLRTDDISSMVLVYPVSAGPAPGPGKQVSLANAQGVEGWINFPTGQGMAGVNVVVRREAGQTTVPDAFYIGSAVTGTYFRRAAHSPFLSADNSPASSFGSADQGELGHYLIGYFPMLGTIGWENLLTSTEPVNPLYTGESSLGPYAVGDVTPGGSTPPAHTSFVTGEGRPQVNLTIADAPAACGAGGDGMASAPAQVPLSGWWNGLLCGYGHASYLAANVKPGRTFTLEVTALNEQGLASDSKAMPVIGRYAATDGPDALPSLAVTPTAFNALTFGTTTLSAPTAHATTLRFGIADQRGDGRPDFAFQGRFFYADDVSPARIATTGGKLTITGSGFRKGNAVTINGVNASVISWSANEIVVTAPTQTAANASSGDPVDIVVSDHGTGASSTISAALIYGPPESLPNSMRLLSAPTGTVLVGDPAGAPLSVQVISPDGSTSVIGDAIVFSAPVGSARFGACGAATCTVITDASGTASTSVTPLAAGPVTLQAADATLSQSASFTAKVQAVSMLLRSKPESPVRVGTPSNSWFEVQVLGPDGRTGLAGRLVTLSVLAGTATFSTCSTAPCTLTTNDGGYIGMPVTPTCTGTITVQAADGDVKQTATFTAISNTDNIQVISTPSPNVYLGDEAGPFTIRLLRSDGATPDPLQTVTFSGPPDLTLWPCGTNTCSITTDWGGQASITSHPPHAGTYTMQVAYGDVLQQETFTVTKRTMQLKLVSAPPDNSATGIVANVPFAVQLLKPDGVTPLTGVTVTLSGTPGAVLLPACGLSSCEILVDGNGIATASVIPLHAGPINLSATYSPLVQAVTFLAAGVGETMRIVTQPGPAGVPFGQVQTLTVQVIGPDGVKPMSWDEVTFTLLSGPFGLLGSASTSYTGHTDGNGMVSCSGIAVGSGPVAIQVTDPVMTQTINFMAGTSTEVMHLVSAPVGKVHVGSQLALPFTVQVFASDGIKAAADRNVTFSVTNGAARFGACSKASCTVRTDENGIASTMVIPTAAGDVALLAADGNVVQAVSFTSIPAPDILDLLAAPASGGYPGVVEALPFSLRANLADGVTPAVSRNITVSVANSAATLAACAGATTCLLQTDATGVVTTAVTPLSAGTITLLAVDGETTLSSSFNVIAKPDAMLLISAPAGNIPAGSQAATAFAVRLLAGDGVTPLVGRPINFSATSGSVQFTVCGSPSCVVVTDIDGIASSGVTPLAPGMDTVMATQGILSQSASFNSVSVPTTLRLTSTSPPIYIAEGATGSFVFTASASENGKPAALVPVQWASTLGLQPALTDTVTDNTGITSLHAQAGPLNGGVQSTMTACAWTDVCTEFHAAGVSASEFRVTIVGGTQQNVADGNPLSPILVQVADTFGHPVASAPVSIFQTVTALNADCPDRGRCPAAPVLRSQVSVLNADANGQTSITPLTVPGTATQTEIVVSSGRQGAASTVLTKRP